MNKISQKVELAANVLIICVTLLLGAVIIQKYFLPSSNSNEPVRVQPEIGKQMNLSGMDWAGQPKTLILALQTNCHFCNESAPFYERLVEIIKNKNVKLVAVFPSNIEESKAHLKELGLTNLEVKQSPLANIQVSGTPTLILINDKGEVTNFWVGKLSPGKEMEVVSKLNS